MRRLLGGGKEDGGRWPRGWGRGGWLLSTPPERAYDLFSLGPQDVREPEPCAYISGMGAGRCDRERVRGMGYGGCPNDCDSTHSLPHDMERRHRCQEKRRVILVHLYHSPWTRERLNIGALHGVRHRTAIRFSARRGEG